MQAEETVEIDRRAFGAVARLRNRDGRANAVVVLLRRTARRCSSRPRRRAERATISFFLFGMGVAATARWRNAGIVLMPIMATPPLFRKMRRETFIVVLLRIRLHSSISRSPTVCRLRYSQTLRLQRQKAAQAAQPECCATYRR